VCKHVSFVRDYILACEYREDYIPHQARLMVVCVQLSCVVWTARLAVLIHNVRVNYCGAVQVDCSARLRCSSAQR
jgi:hypothetical protein